MKKISITIPDYVFVKLQDFKKNNQTNISAFVSEAIKEKLEKMVEKEK